MAIKTFRPKCTVTLKKNVGRKSTGGAGGSPVSQRFSGSKPTIDLTPFLGENGSVVVSRSTRAPEGMWSVTLADKMDQDGQDSLYGLIEPMDVIEISMARDPSKYGSAGLPIMMRGFVSDVRRDMRITARGPERVVTLSGQDYGKILQILRIEYLPGIQTDADLISTFKLFTAYNVGSNPNEDIGSFIDSVMTNVVNPFVFTMMGQSVGASPVSLMTTNTFKGLGVVSPEGANSWGGGSVYDLMSYFGDVGAWAELYVDDTKFGPVLVYRPNPFKSLDGKLTQGGTEPAIVTVSDESLVGMSIARSDRDVINFYWVDAARYNMLSAGPYAAAVSGNPDPPPDQSTYANSAKALYGVRVKRAATQQGIRVDGQGEEETNARKDTFNSFLDTKRKALVANNQDNIVYETGSMSLRGDETIKHGVYLKLARGTNDAGAANSKGLTGQYYAYKVTHHFNAFRSYTTEVEFDRGTGFIERVQRGGGALGPYLSEMDVGGVYAAPLAPSDSGTVTSA